ncbi:hypothetical protein QMZ30_16035 [Pantoea sp. EA-12]|uniref:hypothetical protein n=1 Tax=Pantoea sp. EA-12 TaxID=3043303 RepID=UPI0024B54A12|nr:hypothetical protein [Pantoea sp. EA-12]MDI9222417.1 hypothetical protein [Pantoea sp. EA-12]
MKSANWLVKAIGWLLTHTLQGILMLIMSFTAIASLFVFDNLPMKLTGLLGSFAIAYFASYWLGKARGEHRRAE